MAEALLKKLVDLNYLTAREAEEVRGEYLATGKHLPGLLAKRGRIDEEKLLEVATRELDIPFLKDFEGVRAEVDFISKVPIEFARQYSIVGLAGEGETLQVAAADPFDVYPLDEVGQILGQQIKPVMAPREAINTFISEAYEMDLSVVDSMLGGLGASELDGITREISQSEDLVDMANKAPIVKLINTILFQALKQRASDVHIQPFEQQVQVRCRIDGVLYNIMEIPKVVQEAVTSRIKVMGRMDIAERRLPQDGQTSFVAGGREVDVRISTIPSAYGERTVMRLQDKSTGVYDIRRLGLGDDDGQTLNRLIHMAHGIILVTGPTGSGKTTTLYSAIKEINNTDRNIITVEDPIEYQLAGISQVQVSNKKGMTFATGLRSIVRQDPDVIMVGEIRDLETADIAIQAALTGHLVFSTLHTNDAPGAVSRLLDLGVPPYLVNSALLAVVAQRLMRRLCKDCYQPHEPETVELARYGLAAGLPAGAQLFQAGGCDACQQTGYTGRVGIYEILEVDEQVKEQIATRTSSSQIKKQAVNCGALRTLREDALAKAFAGLTSLEEVDRVTHRDIG